MDERSGLWPDCSTATDVLAFAAVCSANLMAGARCHYAVAGSPLRANDGLSLSLPPDPVDHPDAVQERDQIAGEADYQQHRNPQ